MYLCQQLKDMLPIIYFIYIQSSLIMYNQNHRNRRQRYQPLQKIQHIINKERRIILNTNKNVILLNNQNEQNQFIKQTEQEKYKQYNQKQSSQQNSQISEQKILQNQSINQIMRPNFIKYKRSSNLANKSTQNKASGFIKHQKIKQIRTPGFIIKNKKIHSNSSKNTFNNQIINQTDMQKYQNIIKPKFIKKLKCCNIQQIKQRIQKFNQFFYQAMTTFLSGLCRSNIDYIERCSFKVIMKIPIINQQYKCLTDMIKFQTQYHYHNDCQCCDFQEILFFQKQRNILQNQINSINKFYHKSQTHLVQLKRQRQIQRQRQRQMQRQRQRQRQRQIQRQIQIRRQQQISISEASTQAQI